jgi:predicted transcriptional regulator
MAIEGTLDIFQLPEILQVISQQDMTGILTVQGEVDIVAISFLKGQVVAADSLNQTLEESLGEVLAGQGLVSPNDFAAVAAEHQAGQGRLIDLLVERGHVDRTGLLSALRFHTYRLLVELLAWNEGEFKFYSGDEVSFEEGFAPIGIEEVLIRSVTEAAGEGHPTIPDSWSFYDRVDSLLPVQVRQEDEELAPPDPDILVVSEHESLLLEQMSHSPGGLTVSDLVRTTATDEYKVRYSLHRLLEAGLASRCEPSPQRAAERSASQAAAVGARLEADLTQSGEGTAGSGLRDPLLDPLLEPAGESALRSEAALEPAEAWMSEVGEILDPEDAQARTSVASLIWPGRLLALIPLILLASAVFRQPLHLPLPLPWQAYDRSELEDQLRASIFGKIDRGARTYYLVEGRFPNDLARLIELNLLSPAELLDPLARPLAVTPEAGSYVLQPVDHGRPIDAAATTGTIAGNFLLDARTLSPDEQPDRPVLVLLD